MTPLEVLLTLPDAGSFLREGISLEDLKQQARSMTDIEVKLPVGFAGLAKN